MRKRGSYAVSLCRVCAPCWRLTVRCPAPASSGFFSRLKRQASYSFCLLFASCLWCPARRVFFFSTSSFFCHTCCVGACTRPTHCLGRGPIQCRPKCEPPPQRAQSAMQMQALQADASPALSRAPVTQPSPWQPWYFVLRRKHTRIPKWRPFSPFFSLEPCISPPEAGEMPKKAWKENQKQRDISQPKKCRKTGVQSRRLR